MNRLKKTFLLSCLITLQVIAITCDGFATARAWVGAGAGGGGGATDFNNAANWSPSAALGAGDNLTMTFTSATTITLSASVAINNLTITLSGNNHVIIVDVSTHTLTVNGAFVEQVTGGNPNTFLAMAIGNGGKIIYKSSATYGGGPKGVTFATTGSGGANTTGTVEYDGNVTFGANSVTDGGTTIQTILFDGVGTQTFTQNSASNGIQLGLNLNIGSVNSPTVNFTGAGGGPINVWTNLNINNSSVLDLGTLTVDNGNGAGTFTIAAAARLRLAGLTSGLDNFPQNFTTYNNNNGTVEYYGAGAQIIGNGSDGNPIGGLASTSFHNLTLSGSGVKSLGLNVTVNNILSMEGGGPATFSLNGNTLTYGAAATLQYQATAAQTTNVAEFKTPFTATGGVIINNALGVSLGSASTINSTLTLNNGAFKLNNHTLTINNASTAAVSAGSSTAYIQSEDAGANNSLLKWNIGNVFNSTYVFPFGYAGSYIPFTFAIPNVAGDAGGVGTFISVSTFHTVANAPLPSGIAAADGMMGASGNAALCNPGVATTMLAVNRFWEINSSGNPTANLTFTYTGAENTTDMVNCSGGTTANGLAAQCWESVVGGYWGNYIAGTFNYEGTYAGYTGVTAGTGTVTASAVSGFSTYTAWPWVVSVKANPLPVHLLSFKAQPNSKNEVDASWTTSSETNNDFFTVERTVDGYNYEFVGKVKGAGNSSEPLSYKLTDPNPHPGVSYYRLSQTDFNGTTTPYNPVPVNLNKSASLNLFPNPSGGEDVYMTLEGAKDNQELLLVMYNESGQQVYSKVMIVEQTNNMIKVVDTSNKLSPGIYLVVASSDNKIYRKKVIIQDKN